MAQHERVHMSTRLLRWRNERAQDCTNKCTVNEHAQEFLALRPREWSLFKENVMHINPIYLPIRRQLQASEVQNCWEPIQR